MQDDVVRVRQQGGSETMLEINELQGNNLYIFR